LASPENWTFEHVPQGEIIAIQSNDCQRRAATVRHRYQEIMRFFREKLGFTRGFSYGEPPYYAQVGRDAARLNLRCVERPVIESAVRDREELLSVSMTVATADEIKLLFLEFQSAGVAFHQTLKKAALGSQEFRRQGSGWESAAVCWTRKLTATKPKCADRA